MCLNNWCSYYFLIIFYWNKASFRFLELISSSYGDGSSNAFDKYSN
jgi:hypothetical protein